MIIRAFSERDIDEITSLMKNLCEMKGQQFDEERWRKSLEKRMKEDSSTEVFVAFDKDTKQVLGMGHCSIKNGNNGTRFGYISNLIVKEEKRRSGIGENIMKEMVDFFRNNHTSSIRLSLKANPNEAAKILFSKLGFEEIFRIFELKI